MIELPYSYFLSIAFGEIELSTTTVSILIGISVFIFIAVGISSFSLIRSTLLSDEENEN
ncbi:hypothetical protein [Prochlorococcus marinus]|uniref:hypothetical protein n=1 Tax=Prochlorococcus marinus TaxID=1219 RepID=UPI0022B3E864|nr:hypothetical protein [Prochlorococcus marinus]